MDGLIEVEFTVEVSNKGEVQGDGATPVRFSIEGGEPGLVGVITSLEPEETYTFAFKVLLPHGRPKLALRLGDGDEVLVEKLLPVSDLGVVAVDHSVAGDGVTAFDVEVTNLGELTAENVTLRISWRRVDMGDEAPWETTESEVFAERLLPGASRSKEVWLDLGRGVYEVVVETESPTIEIDLLNNLYSAEILAEYVSLKIGEISTELAGYEPDGRARYEVTMEVSNNGVSPSGTFGIGIECEGVHAADCAVLAVSSVDSIEPGSSEEVDLVWIVPTAVVQAKAYAGSLDDGLLWGEENVEDFVQGAPGQPERLLLLDAVGELFGYWSDGTARVDVSLALRNEGYEPLDAPHNVAIQCSVDGEFVEECSREIPVTLSEGFGPSTFVADLKVPPGHVVLVMDYGGAEPVLIALEIPQKIVGVDREVWECFSDIPAEGETRVGCAAWDSQVVRKWDQSEPVKYWAIGNDSYLRILEEALIEIAPVLNLEFERVDEEADADLRIHTGIDKANAKTYGLEDSCIDFGGCATWWTNENSVVNRGEIIVWDKGDYWDNKGLTERAIHDTTLHELIRAMVPMGHRRDYGSIVNRLNTPLWSEIGGMEEALIRLHSHELIEPGMSISDVESLLVFSDELLDPALPTDATGMDLVKEAYVALREAGSAGFSIRGSWPSPNCGFSFGWAEYEIDEFHVYSPGLVRFKDGRTHIFKIEPLTISTEFWARSAGRWQSLSSRDAFEPTGWRDNFGNPLMALVSVLYYADPDAIQVERLRSNQLKITIQLDEALVRSGNWLWQTIDVEFVLDAETYEIDRYSVDWEVSGSSVFCGKYQLEAKDGEYGIEIEFPDEIVAESLYFK